MPKRPELYKEPGHFFSPVGDPAELRRYWTSDHRAAQTARVDALLDYRAMTRLWEQIAPSVLPFPLTLTEGWRYYGINSEFMYYDASILSAMLAHLNPRRIVEIGAGYSSAAMFDTVDRMAAPRLESFTTIDPDLTRFRRLNPPAMANGIEAMVQTVPMSVFTNLEAGDLLFVDSSHVLKTGSDVHFEYLHILPALKPGVIVQIHDIYYPFEYPRRWVLHHNRSWNELYLVDMMLSHGDRYEVLFFNDAMLQRDALRPHPMFDLFEAAQANQRQGVNGSIWLRKR